MAVTSMSQSSISNFGKRNTFKKPILTYGSQEQVVVGGYTYLLFTRSTAFVIPDVTLPLEILCVGGGGAGGNNSGGGGGAGAIEGAGPGYYASQTLSAGEYTVEVGAGGVSISGYAPGGDTSFYGTSTITAKGGGGGGYSFNTDGQAGGSGGGATENNSSRTGGVASGNNTNPGGDANINNATWGSGAGGGGATVAGTNSSPNNPGEGGEGLALTTIDTNLTSANFSAFAGMTVISSGGGGSNNRYNSGTLGTGAVGGTGGGTGCWYGTSYGSTAGTDATSFGSGGGGGPSGLTGQSGYQGLVIVRYA